MIQIVCNIIFMSFFSFLRCNRHFFNYRRVKNFKNISKFLFSKFSKSLKNFIITSNLFKNYKSLSHIQLYIK